MPVQSSSDYTAEHGVAFEGMVPDLQLKNITSKTCESSDIPFGRAVVRGTGDNQCKLPSAATDEFIGITVHTTDGVEQADGDHLYEQYREANILDFGLMYVYTEQSVVPGDPVFYRHTATTAPLDVVGRFRKDSNSNRAVQINGATFESTTAAGAYAIVKLRDENTLLNASETITASGAISLTTDITYFDSTAGAIAATLADGTEGQIKRVMLTVDGGDVVITPTHLATGATLRLTEVNSLYDLQFSGTSWKIINKVGLAIVTVTATSGALPLDADLILFDSTAGASTSTLADGYEGQIVELKMTVDGGDQVLTPANLLDGTTITYDDAGDSSRIVFASSNWNVIGTPTATVA